MSDDLLSTPGVTFMGYTSIEHYENPAHNRPAIGHFCLLAAPTWFCKAYLFDNR